MPERIPINVAVSVLADISLGIYRTPANALKELVSNAFDADAKRVIINTGYPYFRTITCRDDGKGMSSQDFQEIMSKIGGSVKRKGGRQFTDSGRPIIGKIGIGILAIAQVCRRFTIMSSQKGSAMKFEAQVDFSGLASEEAKEISLGSEKAKDIGSYTIFDDLPEDTDTHYTRIVLEDIEPGFRDRLVETSGPESKIQGFRFKKGDPKALPDFIEWLTTTSARDIPDYYRLLWELSITCPVPYLANGPLKRHHVISEIKKSLSSYDFTVKIDGLELKKLLLFPTSPKIIKKVDDYFVYPIEFNDIVKGSRLAFEGYIYHQRISIQPSELRGLLIRVRNVAIGMYDKSLMNYPKPQGPRMSGISGEIYVKEGLENALNVDRNSFRETDPHYLKLQEVIYTRLGGDKESNTPGIFSDITKRSKAWNIKRQVKQGFQSRKEIQADLEALLNKPFQITTSSKRNAIVPVEINYDQGKVIIYEQHPIFPKSKATRNLLEKILIAYEYANKFCETQDKARDEFYSFLLRGENERSSNK
jgi:hypothetical protein